MLLACTAYLAGCGPGSAQRPEALPAIGARISETSVSGLSAGAYMAGQFQLAHARDVVGAAIIAGGPYGCAESVFSGMVPGAAATMLNLQKAISGCMEDNLRLWGVPDPDGLARRAIERASAGRIGPIEQVRTDRVYLFSGREDRTVAPAIVAAAARFYELLGVPAGQIAHVTDYAAGHALVTSDKGQACGRTVAPYIVDCDYDQAGALLGHILGPLTPRTAEVVTAFITFDQIAYTEGLGTHGLAATGVAYIPSACRAAPGCRIHVVFHGCGQDRDTVGDTFVRDSGFAPWAQANRLVVLFPQVAKQTVNPKACWDWWGYTGLDFLTRDAPQVVAVRRMLERLAERR